MFSCGGWLLQSRDAAKAGWASWWWYFTCCQPFHPNYVFLLFWRSFNLLYPCEHYSWHDWNWQGWFFFLRKYIFNPLFTALCKLLGFWFLLKWLNQSSGHTVGWRPNQKKSSVLHSSSMFLFLLSPLSSLMLSLDQAWIKLRLRALSWDMLPVMCHVTGMHFTPKLSMMSVLSNGNNMTTRFDNRYKNHTSILPPPVFLHLRIYCVF